MERKTNTSKSSHIIWNWMYWVAFIAIIELTPVNSTEELEPIRREVCFYRIGKPFQPVSRHRERLNFLRGEMQMRVTVQGAEIDAYIIPPFDEHQSEEVAERDRRLQYLTGFSGSYGFAAVTLTRAAFFTDDRYLTQANGELPCEWDIFNINNASITDWLVQNLAEDTRVGADPHLIPHFMWSQWERELHMMFVNLVKVNNNLVDVIWGDDRPRSESRKIIVYEQRYAGEKWISKIGRLREKLNESKCDAIVLNSLTEIAYLLNLRGQDLPYTPVFQAYMIITRDEIILYTNTTRITINLQMHLNSAQCFHEHCVKVKEYKTIFRELYTYSQIWKRVFLPSPCVFDLGASEAIFASLPTKVIVEGTSPVIFMRAEKNPTERANMQIAQVRDAAAMCDVMEYIERRFEMGDKLTELKIQLEAERSRMTQNHIKGLSFKTIVAFGPHGALPHYVPSNVTNVEVTDKSTLIIDSGGQYLEGTTEVTRTFHFGEPSQDEKIAYTNVLAGVIRLSMLKFPEDLNPAEIDTLSRSQVWDTMSDYPHGSGHGIGSYLSVHESPIDISYSNKKKYPLRPGYFISNEPGIYKRGLFGVRLENVLEVVDTGRRHPSGAKFLAFEQITLVPFEPKLIDRSLLSYQEKRWLNDYNKKVRDLVGAELKQQQNMKAFHWMMNKTGHVREYLPQHEILKNSGRPTIYNISLYTLFYVILYHILTIINIHYI